MELGKDTAIILVHEIYGVNGHMDTMRDKLSSLGVHVECPNLLHRETPFTYEEESLAYENFVQRVGFERGVQQVRRVAAELKQQYSNVGIMGFSVGATIAWLCSEDRNCDFVVGCYGSRIRTHLDVEPVCPMLLIFPTEEKAFDVQTLLDALQNKNNPQIQVEQFQGGHGFIDPYSPHYNKVSEEEAWSCMESFLSRDSRA